MKNWTHRSVIVEWDERVNPRARFLGRFGEDHFAEVFQPFGHSYCPPLDGSEGIIIPGQGSNDLKFSPGFTGGRYRPKAEEGGSILYSTADGTQVRANPDGSVAITTAGGGSFVFDGEAIKTNMTIETTGDVIADGVSLKEHVHGGVRSGSSNTDEPVT